MLSTEQRRRALLKLYAARDAIAEPMIERKVDCRPGCSTCCKIAVAVTKDEGAILSELKTTRIDQSMDLWCEVDGDMVEYMRGNVACAFLADDGMCSAYDKRPLRCRLANSTDVENCKNPTAKVKRVDVNSDPYFESLSVMLSGRDSYLMAAAILHARGLMNEATLEHYRMGKKQ